jgi:hypothetical protein
VRVLLHVVIEHKSHDDRFTAWQTARYVVRVIDRWLADHPEVRWLPMVLPVVVHHGDHPWQAPRSVHDLVGFEGVGDGVGAFLRPLQLQQRFHLVDLGAMSEAVLDTFRLSAISGLTLRFLQFLRRVPPDAVVEHIRRWQHLVVQVLEHPRGQDVLFALLSWWFAGAPGSPETLRNVMVQIREEIPPMQSMLDLILAENEARGLQRGLQQGLQQGMQQGTVHGRRELLAELATQRFGPLPEWVLASIGAADLPTLQRHSQRWLAATTLADVFA